jgi:endonuclease/exonuclease/phosphatase (EEP) superfamily protein YafD
MEMLLIGIGSLMIVATALPLLRRDDWWIRIFDFPRLQITVVLAATFAGYLIARSDPTFIENIFLGALAASLAYQAWRMYPYTPLHARQVEDSRKIDAAVSLAFVNVLMTNRKAQAVLREVRRRDPDVILAVETDAWWETQLAELEQTHPFVVKQAQDNTYGMLLYSRLELHTPKVEFLIEDDVPSIHATVRLSNGADVELHCMHVPPRRKRATARPSAMRSY